MKKLLSAIGLSALLFVGACSTTGSERGDIIAELGITVATFRFIDGDPDRADRVVKLTEKVVAVLEEDALPTMPILLTLVEAQIPWQNYAPVEQALIRAIIELVAVDLEKVSPELGDVITPERKDRLLRLVLAIQQGALAVAV